MSELMNLEAMISPETSPATMNTLSSPALEAKSLTLSLLETENDLLITLKNLMPLDIFATFQLAARKMVSWSLGEEDLL